MDAAQHPLKWDLLIRLFHWSLAGGFLLNSFIIDDGESLHEWIGYFVLGWIAVRIVWGFVGSTNARFKHFMPSPSNVRQHILALRQGQFDHEEGHTPLGALMIFALLTTITLTGATGWLSTLDLFWGEDWVESLHEFFANAALFLVTLHVSAVILISRLSGDNLIKPMIKGR